MCPECGSKLGKYYDEEHDHTVFYCTNDKCGYVATEGGDQT